MRIYPAVDILGGKCVRLMQGGFDSVTVHNGDPAAQALVWQGMGASFLHLVDLDGARMGGFPNRETVARIIGAVGVPVQLGGGVRCFEDISERIDMGVSRVILGTAAVTEEVLMRRACETYGDKIAIGVDALNGTARIFGWKESSGVSALELCRRAREAGVRTVIYTDISKDGMMLGPNAEATAEVIAESGMEVIASGGVSSADDLERVFAAGAAGVIIGKALYTGSVNLREAIEKYEKDNTVS